MKAVAVLGAGSVGSLVARDLASSGSIRVAAFDRDAHALEALRLAVPGLKVHRCELTDGDAVHRAARDVDAVVVAVPGFLGHAVLRRVLEVGRPAVDVSFSPEDPRPLHGLAVERGVAAVVDCGVAPGLSNILVGRSVAELDRVDEVLILVGGLPRRRELPWEYRAPFSPTDVLEEYTRPCRIRIRGVEESRPALSDLELVDFPEVGTLEAFNTDGLRTLLSTVSAATMREKTLRYPGHAERIRLLLDSGFLDPEPVVVDGTPVIPRAVTEALLFPRWKPRPGEEEFTLLRVVVEGVRGNRRSATTWDLFDFTDLKTGASSMARTTGFPCAAVARILLDGSWSSPGVHPPENLGRAPGVAERIIGDLASRGVIVRHRTEG